jgi:thiamine-phosphate pyrophosphorylase
LAVGADGLHLPERMLDRLPRLRARHRRWIVTAAVHSAGALMRAERAGADAALLSSAFPSRSPSHHVVLGTVRFAQLTGLVDIPVVALGGVTGATARRIGGTGAAGLAAVAGWSS